MITRIVMTIFAGLVALSSSTVFAQAAKKPSTPKVQRVTINLTERGYRPSSFSLKKGVRTRLTFVRKTDATCGQVIVMPAYGVRRDLPLNQPVTIIFMPRKTGTFNFTCGMNMLRGMIIVRCLSGKNHENKKYHSNDGCLCNAAYERLNGRRPKIAAGETRRTSCVLALLV